MSRGKAKDNTCCYNIGVNCEIVERPCGNCGWNPKVEARRKTAGFAISSTPLPVVHLETKPERAQGEDAPKRKPHPHSRPVVCVETGEVFPSVRQAAAFRNLDPSSITKACKGAYSTVCGFHWKYVDRGDSNAEKE